MSKFYFKKPLLDFIGVDNSRSHHKSYIYLKLRNKLKQYLVDEKAWKYNFPVEVARVLFTGKHPGGEYKFTQGYMTKIVCQKHIDYQKKNKELEKQLKTGTCNLVSGNVFLNDEVRKAKRIRKEDISDIDKKELVEKIKKNENRKINNYIDI